MPRTLGAEMPTATPTKKIYNDMFLTLFEKYCYENVIRIISVGLDGVKSAVRFRRNRMQKLGYKKVNLS